MFIQKQLKLIFTIKQNIINTLLSIQYFYKNNHIIIIKKIYINFFNICFKTYIKNLIFKTNLNITCSYLTFKKIILFLKLFSILKYNTLIDITAVDFPGKSTRFLLKYIKLNINIQNYLLTHILITYKLNEITWTKTLTNYYNIATFYEREVFDMFGIYFLQNPELFRILTDYGFTSFPLRKDFPLSGFEELHYNEIKKKLINIQDFWLIYLKNHKNKQLNYIL